MSSTNPLAKHATVLDTLDPERPHLDDLAPLGAVVDGARVVAIGEGAHFVREFTLARARLLRYLIERHGFDVVAFELGDADARAVNPWLAGEGDETDLPAGPLTVGVFGELLRWLRGYNRGRSHPVQIVGIDLPNSLTPRPDLEPVADYLRLVDPDAADLVATVLRTAEEIGGGSAVVSASQWGGLSPARRDELTAGLARLALRMDAMEPIYVSRSDQRRFDAARDRLQAACHTDHMLRAMNDLFSGGGLPADTSVRDRFMATSVRRHLERAPDARMVVVAHNSHIQKTPVAFDGNLVGLPMGHYLARSLGERYRAVALTHTGGHVPEMILPADDSPVGFTVEPVALDAPPEGSVEGALCDAGLQDGITLTDLRSVTSLNGIRAQSAIMNTPLHEAFDAVLSTPAATMDDTLPF